MIRFWSCLAGVAFCILPGISVEAAMLYVEPATAELQPGETAVLEVRVNVNEDVDECINLVDGVLTASGDVEIVDTSIGRSILRLWVEEPTITDQTVTFAGGLPNGYCGRIAGDPEVTNVVAEIVVRSTATDGTDTSSTLSFADETTVYLNDGSGTRAPLDMYGAELSLVPRSDEPFTDEWLERVEADTTDPEPFSISLEQNENLFNGRYYITYNTSDKQTGIAEYFVMEEPIQDTTLFNFGAASAPWRKPDFPTIYELEDQTLNSTIRVRAVDKAGNEYIATLVPDESLRTNPYNVWWYVGGGAFALLLIFLLGTWYVRYRRRAPTAATHSERSPFVNETHEPPRNNPPYE